jgi:hypothetical protein
MASSLYVAYNPALRVSAEFREMPGLKLTALQASRLFGLNQGECQSLLAQLVTQGFLICTPEGQYVRPSMRQSRA